MRLRAFLILLAVIPPLFLPCTTRAQNSRENADFKLAINLYNDGLSDLAAEQLKQFINNYPNSDQGIEARYYLGLTQLKLKQYEEARLTFQTFALTYQNNPKAPDAWWNVGESFAATHNYREAALAFERVKVFHPKSKLAPDALVQAGKYFMLAGEKDNARRVLRIVMQEYGSSAAAVTARTQLGKLYFEEGNFPLAQNELKRVVESDPSPDARAQALLILGNIYQATGRAGLAQTQYQEIITKHKTSSAVQAAYINLARLQMDAGKPADAVESYKKALAEKTQSDSALVRQAMVGIGDALAAVKDYGNATTQYEKYIAAFPQDESTPDLLWKIARVSARGKNFKKSNEACARILKSSAPERLKRRSQLLMAVNAQDQHNAALAVQLYGTFIENYGDDPTTAEVLFRTGQIQEKELRDYRKASVLYELLVARHSTSPLVDEALAGAARCQEQLKEFDRAAQIYNDLVSRYPASELRPAAEERIRIIETFESKDKDAGLEKLAMLVGDVVADKDKAGLAFRLGEIYFKDLKNYAAAATQFTNAYTSGIDVNRTAEALYLRAKSYEYMSWKDNKYRTMAVESYQTFLQTAGASQAPEVRVWREDAAVSVFTLSATTLLLAQSAYQATVALLTDGARRDEMLLRIGDLQQRADSNAAALGTFSEIVREYPSSPHREEALYRCIGLLHVLGLPDSAAVESQLYLSAYPSGRHTAAVLSAAAGAAMQRGDNDRAATMEQELSTGFFYTADAANARRLLADATAARGNAAEAVGIYNELVEQQSSNLFMDDDVDPSLLLALGKAQFQAGNKEDAKRALFRCLAAAQSGKVAGEACTAIGMMYRSEGSTELATSYFRRAATISPDAAGADVAAMLFDSGEYDDAVTQYGRLVETAASDSEKQIYEARLILALLRNDELQEAEKRIAAFTKTYQASSVELASIELEKGNYLFRKENYPAALKAFHTVADKYDDTPSAPVALYWIGKTQEASGSLKEAVDQLTQLVQNYPGDPILPRAYLALGNLWFNLEKWDEAIKNFRKIVDDPNADLSLLPFAMSNLIETYEIAGLNDAALALTRKYLDLFPNNEDSFDKRIKIGILYQRLGYYDQSVLQLQGLLDEAGSDLEGEIRYYIAEGNYYKGDYQQAILDFLKVPYLVTKKGKIDWTANSLYMSGQSYEKMGRFDQALIMYQQILDRSGIDETYKAAARKEIDRVKLVLKKK